MVGDTLGADGFPALKVDLVVCDPPSAMRDWGREKLLYDARWAFGLPARGESDLAWLQHCYSHLVPGGTALVLLASSAAARRTGRRIRAEILRQGALTGIVALPAGLAVDHPHPLHAWILTRPIDPGTRHATIEMIDAGSATDRDDPLASAQRCTVAAIDLLDDEVDLNPARHMAAPARDLPAETALLNERIRQALEAVSEMIPRYPENKGEPLPPPVSLGELAQAGAITFAERGEWSTDPSHLDAGFVEGFLHSPDNRRRHTSATGIHRVDVRSALVPRMPIDRQGDYAAAFKQIDDFRAAIEALTSLAAELAADTNDGLTTGVLAPRTLNDSKASSTGETT